jgi:hypothetical protein
MTAKAGVMSVVTAPLYPSKDMYPVSPIQVFPPPMPARQSLRSRCGVTMQLHLSTLGLTPPSNAWASKGHTQPHRHNLPRRRNPKRITVVDHDEPTPKVEVVANVEKPVAHLTQAKASSPAHVHPNRHNLPRHRKVHRMVVHDTDDDKAKLVMSKPKSVQGVLVTKAQVTASYPAIESPYIPTINPTDDHLINLIPNVFMAYGDADTSLENLPGYHPAEPYTHVVRINYSDAESAPITRSTEGKSQHLHLNVTSSTSTGGNSRAGLELTDAQLRTARDFMAEVLPRLDSPNGVKLIVVGPHGHPANVVAVAACYFAFVSGKSIEEVLLFIDAEEDFSSAWKGEVTDDEAERVQKIAKAWSWLSSIVHPGSHP